MSFAMPRRLLPGTMPRRRRRPFAMPQVPLALSPRTEFGDVLARYDETLLQCAFALFAMARWMMRDGFIFHCAPRAADDEYSRGC